MTPPDWPGLPADERERALARIAGLALDLQAQAPKLAAALRALVSHVSALDATRERRL